MAALTFDDLLDLWESTTDESYHRPILDSGDPEVVSIVGQSLTVLSTMSSAVESSLQALFVLPHSSQTAPQAHGESKTTVTVSFSRTKLISMPLILKAGQLIEQIDTDWGDNGGEQVKTGRRYKILEDVIFQVGEAGPKTVVAEAEFPGDGYNLPVIGTITGLVYTGAGFNGKLAGMTTTPAPTGSTASSEWRLVAREANDVFSPDHANQYLKFIDGSNIGRIVRISSYISPGTSDGGSVLLDGVVEIRTGAPSTTTTIPTGRDVRLQLGGTVLVEGQLIAQRVSGSDYYWLVRVVRFSASAFTTATSLVDPLQPGITWTIAYFDFESISIVSDLYSSWKILDWVEDFGLTVVDVSSATGGKFGTLDDIGSDRRVYRQIGETDSEYADRLSMLADTIAPNAVRRKLVSIWSPTGKSTRLIETESSIFPGMFLDVDALDRSSPFDESDDYKVLVDERSMRGYMIAEVPRISDGDMGLVLDGDGPTSVLDGPAALDGFSPTAKSLYKRTHAAMESVRAAGVDFDLRLPPADVEEFKWTPKDITSPTFKAWIRADLGVGSQDTPFDTGGATTAPKIVHAAHLNSLIEQVNSVSVTILLSNTGNILIEHGAGPKNTDAIHIFGGAYLSLNFPFLVDGHDFWAVVQVMSSTVGVSYQQAGCIYSTIDHAGDQMLGIRDDGTFFQSNDDGVIDYAIVPSVFSKWFKVRAFFSAGVLSLSLNDSVPITATSGNNVTGEGNFTIGRDFDSGQYCDIRIAEFFASSSKITADEEVNMQRYLKLRYGL